MVDRNENIVSYCGIIRVDYEYDRNDKTCSIEAEIAIFQDTYFDSSCSNRCKLQ